MNWIIISIVLVIIAGIVFSHLNRKKIEEQKKWILENDERILALQKLNNHFDFAVFSTVQYLSTSVKSRQRVTAFVCWICVPDPDVF